MREGKRENEWGLIVRLLKRLIVTKTIDFIVSQPEKDIGDFCECL